MSVKKKRNYLHIIDMAKNKTVLQTLGFAFASQCVFTTLPLGEKAVKSTGGVAYHVVEQIC